MDGSKPLMYILCNIYTDTLVKYIYYLDILDKSDVGLTEITMRIKPINPVAKAVAQSRRRTTVVPDKTKYNRKKDKDDANKTRKAND